MSSFFCGLNVEFSLLGNFFRCIDKKNSVLLTHWNKMRYIGQLADFLCQRSDIRFLHGKADSLLESHQDVLGYGLNQERIAVQQLSQHDVNRLRHGVLGKVR